jgi:hypothetical protein
LEVPARLELATSSLGPRRSHPLNYGTANLVAMAGFEPAMTALKERWLNPLAHIAIKLLARPEGFEPSISWLRTRRLQPLAHGLTKNSGAAGRTRTLIDPLTACCLEDSAGTAANSWWAARNSNPAPRVKSPVLQTVKACSPERLVDRQRIELCSLD